MIIELELFMYCQHDRHDDCVESIEIDGIEYFCTCECHGHA